MENVRRIRVPSPPPWSGREKVEEATAKLEERDFDGAVQALVDAVGPDVREWSDEERPYVAAAALLLAGVLDEMGDSPAALRVYTRAFDLFGGDNGLLASHAWLAESMDGARAALRVASRTRIDDGAERPSFLRQPNAFRRKQSALLETRSVRDEAG